MNVSKSSTGSPPVVPRSNSLEMSQGLLRKFLNEFLGNTSKSSLGIRPRVLQNSLQEFLGNIFFGNSPRSTSDIPQGIRLRVLAGVSPDFSLGVLRKSLHEFSGNSFKSFSRFLPDFSGNYCKSFYEISPGVLENLFMSSP